MALNLKGGKDHLKRWHTEEYGITKDLHDHLQKYDMKIFDPSLAVKLDNKKLIPHG